MSEPSIGVSELKSDLSIGIIIPTYNVGDYIFDCLVSCMMGGVWPATLYVVDDGSCDHTVSEIRRFMRKYPDQRIFLHQESRRGAGYNRNLMLERVAEDFVAFVDGDDLISRTALERICSQMQSFCADMAAPCTLAFDDLGRSHRHFDLGVTRFLDGRPLVVTESRSSPEILDFETSMCMRVFSRRFMFDQNIKFGSEFFCEDVTPSRTSFLCAERVLIINEVYYFYRLNRAGQRTSAVNKSTAEVSKVIKESIKLGTNAINDNHQGAYFLVRLLRIAFWSRDLIPMEMAPHLRVSLAKAFLLSPRGWWRALYALDESTSRMKRLANLVLTGADEQSLARVFSLDKASFADRVLKLVRGRK